MSAGVPYRLGVRAVAWGGVGAGFAWAASTADDRVLRPDALGLAACVTIANLLAVRYRGRLWLSASFTFSMLAIARLGPAAAFAIVAVAECATWAIERYAPTAAAINLLGSGIPNLVAGTVFGVLAGGSADLPVAAALTFASILAIALSFVIVAALTGVPAEGSVRIRFPDPRALVAPLCWNVATTVVLVMVALESVTLLSAVLFGLTAAGFVHMLRLGASERLAHERSERVSSEVLDGLMRTLEQRGPAYVRHAKAVGRYAQDIARATGFDEARAEAAYIAGVVHDIGLAADGDLAVRSLTVDDWRRIREHPRVGADLLSAFPPISEAVHAHHERVDGRGYPRGLAGGAIPELGRIVAVAEVYATLTAPARSSSFQALHEVRRVAGTQLDARYVEGLANALAGKPREYRHAGAIEADSPPPAADSISPDGADPT